MKTNVKNEMNERLESLLKEEEKLVEHIEQEKSKLLFIRKAKDELIATLNENYFAGVF